MKCAGCNAPLEPVAYCEKCRDQRNEERLEHVKGFVRMNDLSLEQLINRVWLSAIMSERGKL